GSFFRRLLGFFLGSSVSGFTGRPASATTASAANWRRLWFWFLHDRFRLWFADRWNLSLFFLLFFLLVIFIERFAVTASITEFVGFVVTQVEGFLKDHFYASSSGRRSAELRSYVAGKFKKTKTTTARRIITGCVERSNCNSAYNWVADFVSDAKFE